MNNYARDKPEKLTDIWNYYSFGEQFNCIQKPDQYSIVETNTEFFNGNQWIHLPDNDAMRRLPKPVFNIIKRVTSLFVASLTSSGTTISFEPLLGKEDDEAAKVATDEVRNLLEKLKMDYRIRDALFDGAITGDYCAHFFWNPDAKPYGGASGECRGEIEMEMIDGINVMFGNPNIRDVEKQPYIIITGRDTVENLKNEAKRWKAVQRTAEVFRAFDERYGYPREPGKVDCCGGGKFTVAENFPDVSAAGKDNCCRENIRAETGTDDCCGAITDPAAGITSPAPMFSLYGQDTPIGRVLTEEDLFDDDPPIVADAGNGIHPNIQAMGLHGNDDKTSTAQFIYFYEKRRHTVSVPDENEGVKNIVRDTVFVTKVTRNFILYSEVDTGLSRYPVAWGNWQKQKNSYHGRALVTEVVPNQIFVNQMMAMVFRHLQTQAFPTKIYNADYLPQISNEVGTAIGVRNLMPGQTLGSIISTLPSADMSNQIIQAIDLCVQYTKDCLGATDAQLGNLQATNTSALMVLQNASEIPLENMRANLHEWIEDIGAILLDMMGTYYGNRPILREEEYSSPVLGGNGMPLIDPMTGTIALNTETRKALVQYDFTKFKQLWLNISADVGATSYYSEIAMVQTLDNLRKEGFLDIVDYLERIPDSLISRKDELIDKLKKKAEANELQQGLNDGTTAPAAGATGKPIQNDAYSMGGPLDAEKKLAALPANLQVQYGKLPVKARNALMSYAGR
ncbi:MAG: hypothetical protein Q4F31_10740 [Eubacteriales bacterium]|nr:hypothetical protein [Eubacteriales bacterium]